MKSPVVVFIYGGAWSGGERSTYGLLGRQMAEEMKATVICPDYCTYPKVTALEQRGNPQEAIIDNIFYHTCSICL